MAKQEQVMVCKECQQVLTPTETAMNDGRCNYCAEELIEDFIIGTAPSYDRALAVGFAFAKG